MGPAIYTCIYVYMCIYVSMHMCIWSGPSCVSPLKYLTAP